MVADIYINNASMAIDGTAIFFLGGLIYYTSAFRKRGRLSDRLFFMMLVTDIVAAVFDIMVDFFEFRPGPYSAAMMMAGSTVFNLAIIFAGSLLMLYALSYTENGVEKVRKSWKYWMIPAVVSAVFFVINLFTGWITYVDRADNLYHHGPLYYVVYIPLYIYLLLAAVYLWKVNRSAVIILIALVAVRLIMEALFQSVSSTPFFVSVILTYLHVGEMNNEFDSEVDR